MQRRVAARAERDLPQGRAVALPLSSPKRFAMDRYVQDPALMIRSSLPLFDTVGTPALLLVGESHAVAQAMVALHGFRVVALGCLRLAPSPHSPRR